MEEYPLANDSVAYSNWRRNIALEYIAETGRAFPGFGTDAYQNLALRIVQMSDEKYPPSPSKAVQILIKEGFLIG